MAALAKKVDQRGAEDCGQRGLWCVANGGGYIRAVGYETHY